MNAKTETGASALDVVKLVLSIAVLVGGVVGYYYFTDQSILVRVAGVLAAVALSIVIFLQSDQGRRFWTFFQSSRIEVRKMVWPTRQETLQTTMVVIFFTIIMAVFFWLLDMLLLWATRALTGLGD